MALYLNTNFMLRNAARSLNASYGYLDRITERLLGTGRTGGAVAVSLSNRVAADIAAIGAEISSVNIQISVYQTAEDALTGLTGKLADMQELARQADSGAYTDQQVAAMDAEFQQLAGDVSDVLNDTSFGETPLLTGAGSLVSLDFSDVSEVSLTDLTDGALSAVSTFTAEVTAARASLGAHTTALAASLTSLANQSERLSAFEYRISSVDAALGVAAQISAGIQTLFELALSAQGNTMADTALRLLDLNLSDD